MALSKTVSPPLINSSNPWATNASDLKALYDCPHTGAVTTRTSLLYGFAHDDSTHQFKFFDAGKQIVSNEASSAEGASSLNTLGYSPLPLAEYLAMISEIVEATPDKKKPFIVSVTGTPEEITECHSLIAACARSLHHPLFMEINLSCPNIADKPPPAYDGTTLREYLAALQATAGIVLAEGGEGGGGDDDDKAASDASHVLSGLWVPVGIKVPPYTYAGQFQTLVDALLDTCVSDGAEAEKRSCPVRFVTATNTLGSSLLMTAAPRSESKPEPSGSSDWGPALASSTGAGIGGAAGALLHPLALGNVATLRRMLDSSVRQGGEAPLSRLEIIGVGGVSDHAGYERMRTVGATCVGVGTALGVKGVEIFGDIWKA